MKSSARVRGGNPTGPSWAASAFIVEAIVLLAFLVASSAVFVQLFSVAHVRSEESGMTAAAVAAATSTAERFAANPTSVSEVVRVGDLVVACETTPEKRAGGTLYQADISVYKGVDVPVGEITAAELADGDRVVVYATSTAVYMSEASG